MKTNKKDAMETKNGSLAPKLVSVPVFQIVDSTRCFCSTYNINNAPCLSNVNLHLIHLKRSLNRELRPWE